MEIIANTLSEAHEKCCAAIIDSHKEIDIQTHVDKKEFTIEFEEYGAPGTITMIVLHPLAESQVSPAAPYGPKFSQEYKKQFLTLTPPREDGKQAVYTYFNRLADYPHTGIDGCGNFSDFEHGDGNGTGYNRIALLIEKLASDVNSRRGVIVTWDPLIDAGSIEPPCMDLMQIIIRNEVVHMKVYFRSQDALLGLVENLVGGAALLEYITGEINEPLRDACWKADIKFVPLRVGTLTFISAIPHIYKRRDSPDFDRMRARIHELKTFGKW